LFPQEADWGSTNSFIIIHSRFRIPGSRGAPRLFKAFSMEAKDLLRLADLTSKAYPDKFHSFEYHSSFIFLFCFDLPVEIRNLQCSVLHSTRLYASLLYLQNSAFEQDYFASNLPFQCNLAAKFAFH